MDIPMDKALLGFQDDSVLKRLVEQVAFQEQAAISDALAN